MVDAGEKINLLAEMAREVQKLLYHWLLGTVRFCLSGSSGKGDLRLIWSTGIRQVLKRNGEASSKN